MPRGPWEEVRLRTLALAAAVSLLAACGASKELEVQRARLHAERRALEATFDHLEDRLLVNQARVRFWQEMRERHEGVTAVACTSLEQHAEEIARRMAPPPARQASAVRTSLHESRVAARAVPRAEPSPAARAARSE
ncbi:conserved hypothetical protein [Anaeromyxobacter sp. Fw109-5]|nr:conserved hypothetical protein [Anaeromyxobacter sp. Fw109-5]